MDFWGVFMIFLLTFLIMSCCGYCCVTKRRGAVLSTPVVVTSATHTAPGGYPVTQIQTPYQQYPAYPPATAHAAPYPVAQGMPPQMQMPMPMPMQPNQTTYGMPAPAMNMNPPSYDMATGGGAGVSAAPPNSTLYEKQSPYNPSFTTH